MILGTATVYECDNATCSKQADGHTRRPPKGWKAVQWIPGIIVPPGVPAELLRPRRWHYCSETCLEADKPQREAHEKQVRAAIHENDDDSGLVA